VLVVAVDASDHRYGDAVDGLIVAGIVCASSPVEYVDGVGVAEEQASVVEVEQLFALDCKVPEPQIAHRAPIS